MTKSPSEGNARDFTTPPTKKYTPGNIILNSEIRTTNLFPLCVLDNWTTPKKLKTVRAMTTHPISAEPDTTAPVAAMTLEDWVTPSKTNTFVRNVDLFPTALIRFDQTEIRRVIEPKIPRI